MQVIKINESELEKNNSNLFIGGNVSNQSLIGELEGKDFIAKNVHFNAGAKTKLHTHSNDQLLIVTGGKGLVGNEKEEVTVDQGTVIIFPAGEKHFHGATEDSEFWHIYVIKQGTKTEW